MDYKQQFRLRFVDITEEDAPQSIRRWYCRVLGRRCRRRMPLVDAVGSRGVLHDGARTDLPCAAPGRVFLAGEHTCYAFVGYMEGALQSGARAAKRIAALS